MIDRNLLLKGPAVVIRGGHTYFTQGDIVVKVNVETYSIPSNILGSSARRITSKSVTVSFKPQGLLDSAAAYFPWGVADIGASIFGATDTPLVIHTVSGQTLTFPASANLGARTLHLGTDASAIGEISFLCLGALSTSDSTDESRYALAAAAYASAGPDRAKLRTPGYMATLVVGTGESAVETELHGLEGFDVNIEYAYDPDTVNAFGLVGQTLADVSAHALFKPCNLTVAETLALLSLQDAGCREIGDEAGNPAAVLTIAPHNSGASGVTAVLYGVGAVEAEFRYGLKSKRVQGVRFDASPILDTVFKLFTVTFPTWD